MSKEEKQNLEEESRALKDSMSFVIGKKLPIPKNWSGKDLEDLEFPDDLSRLTTMHLGELLGIWSSVMAYAQYEVARTDIEKTARWNRYEFEKKKAYLVLVNDIGKNEEQRKSEVYMETAALRSDFEVAKAKYVLTNALLGAYSKYYQALSRELSRRNLDGYEKVPKEQDEEEIDLSEGRDMLTKEWEAVDEAFEAGYDERTEEDEEVEEKI